MFSNLRTGNLHEPVSGRIWTDIEIKDALKKRVFFYYKSGIKPGDRVLILYGNIPRTSRGKVNRKEI